MACYDWHQLVRYDEGDLPAAEAGAVARHVSVCAVCRARFETVKQSWKTLELLDTVPLPAAAYREIPRQAARAGTVRVYRTAIIAAAALLLVCFGLAMAYRQWQTRQMPADTAAVTPAAPADHAASAATVSETPWEEPRPERQPEIAALPPVETPVDEDPWQDVEVLAALRTWESHPELTAEIIEEKAATAERDLALLLVLFEE